MKWLVRLLSRKKKTPLPPKPYIDTSSAGGHMIDPRFYDTSDLAHIDPEKPYWQDARFDSRQDVPFFDFFGFNRDWSWSLFKFSTIFLVVLMYWEMRTFMLHDVGKFTGNTGVSAVPAYARNEKATEEELRKAGFAYVGFKNLDNLGVVASTPPRDPPPREA